MVEKSEVKKWLKLYGFYLRRGDATLEEIERQRSRAEKVTTSYSHTPGSSGTGDRVGQGAVTIVDMQKSFETDYAMAKRYLDEIRWCIDTVVEDYNQRNVLTFRYIYLHRWEEVAYRLHYSWQGVHKVHNNALQFIADHWPWPEPKQ